MRRLHLSVPLLFLSTGLIAQQVPDFEWRIPIHTGDADPVGGEYGVWASGPDYKVSFHDGFEFVPILGGEAARNLPMRWETRSVRFGATELWESAAVDAATAGDWTWTYRSGTVTERYDLTAEGAEQSFVIDRRPIGESGDLVVIGALGGPLRADAVGGEHRPVALRDPAGRAVLEYGSAFVLDALGCVLAIPTTSSANRIELRVPSAWLAEAVFPVTIDPLVRVTTLVSGSFAATPLGPDVVRDAQTDRIWVQYGRYASSTDVDAVGLLLNDDFTVAGTAFSDVTSSWSSTDGEVTVVGGASRFVVALAREFTASKLVRVYAHAANSTNTNSGTTLFVSSPSGRHANPTIGGSPAGAVGTTAFLAFEVEGASYHRVVGALVDAVNATVATPADLFPGNPALADQRHPSITRTRDSRGGFPWIVTWQRYELGRSGAAFRPWLARVSEQGVVGTPYLPAGMTSVRHQIRPHVAGFGERMMLVFTSQPAGTLYTDALGDSVRGVTLIWPRGSTFPTAVSPLRILDSGLPRTLTTEAPGRPLDVDRLTRSHWGAVWSNNGDCVVARIGDGHVVETTRFAAGAAPWGRGGVCFDPEAASFVVGYTVNSRGTAALRVARLEHRNADLRIVGGGCAGTLRGFHGTTLGVPHKGSPDFQLYLAGARQNAVTAMLIGSGLRDLYLPFFGAGCRLRLDPAGIIATIGGSPASSSSVSGAWQMPLPVPALVGDFDLDVQAVQIDAGLVWFSEAVRLEIR